MLGILPEESGLGDTKFEIKSDIPTMSKRKSEVDILNLYLKPDTT